MEDKKYNVGQIIYVLSDDAARILPAIIAEENTNVVKKLDGTHKITTYKIAIGPKEKRKFANLTSVKGEIFGSLEEIEKLMIERLRTFVSGLIDGTEKTTKEWYGVSASSKESAILEENENVKYDPQDFFQSINEDKPLSKSTNLPRHDLAIPLQSFNETPLNELPREAMREKLQRMASPEEDEMENGLSLGGQEKFVTLPDGSRVPVKI